MLIRQYLTTGRMYTLIKKYALNKHVRLLTRLYGKSYNHVGTWAISMCKVLDQVCMLINLLISRS